jgi:hypothetical protein
MIGVTVNQTPEVKLYKNWNWLFKNICLLDNYIGIYEVMPPLRFFNQYNLIFPVKINNIVLCFIIKQI